MPDPDKIAREIMKLLGYDIPEETMQKYKKALHNVRVVEDDEFDEVTTGAAIKGSDDTGRSAPDGSFPGTT